MSEGMLEQFNPDEEPQVDFMHGLAEGVEGELPTITDNPWAMVNAEGKMIGVKDLPEDASLEDRKDWRFVKDMFGKGNHFKDSAE